MKADRFKPKLKKIKALAERFRDLADSDLQKKTTEFKERIRRGESLNALLPEAYAVICETDRRILGKMPYDCQILGAIAMHLGYLAEMNTGEGKTLTATMPLYLNALTGKSVILVTANAYLAQRDAEEMGPVYRFLGMTVSAGAEPQEAASFHNSVKKKIYSADIVYTTHGALGFDYLLNNLVADAKDRFLRDFNYVLIDEADAVLLDAAQMPLVISGAPRVQSNLYKLTDFFVTTLKEDVDYEEEEKAVWLTKKGVAYAEHFFGIKRFYAAENFEINRHVTMALRAHVLFEKEKDYVISEKGELVLLDNGTGRSMPGMKLRGGQHQALEAKENLELSTENRSVASITYQNLFLMFPRFSGMSGTISDASRELKEIYKKKVVIIPPNKPLLRKDLKDRYFKNAEDQFRAAIDDVIERHSTGQPVLIVTPTIADTELVSRVLVKHSIPHSVLNAENAFWEADMIREAGRKNAVTVSTGMAGRGTDIKLEKGAAELGGLAVIGVGRMGNVRLERQARGRAGRQGDPGVSRFYVSLEDEVVLSIGEDKLEKYVDKDRYISGRHLKNLIDGSQKFSEEQAVDQRSSAVDYDKVMKKQRAIMYAARNRLLDGEVLDSRLIRKIMHDSIGEYVRTAGKLTKRDIIRYILDNMTYSYDTAKSENGIRSRRKLRKNLCRLADTLLDWKLEQFASPDEAARFLRICVLHAIDAQWVEEVDYLQQLQAAVSGRAYAQRDIVVEYQREAYAAFEHMKKEIRREIVRNILLGEVQYGKKGEFEVCYP